MFLVLEAILWNSLAFLYIFGLYFSCWHLGFFNKADIEITIAISIILAFLVGGLITRKYYRTYGISSLRLLSGKTRKFLGLNYVQSVTLPLGIQESYDLIVKLVSDIFEDNAWKYDKSAPALYAAGNRNVPHLTVFYFNSISPAVTQIEISTRANPVHYVLYDFKQYKNIVNFWMETLEKRDSTVQFDTKSLRERFQDIENKSFDAIFTNVFMLFMLSQFLFMSHSNCYNIFDTRSIIPSSIPFQIRVGIDKPYGKLTEDDCASITELDLSGQRLFSLNGIQLCKNLNTLNLNNCKIKDLKPLGSCINLANLSLDSNRISNVSPLESLVKLKTLNISNNQISDLRPFLNLPGLERLDISYNRITDFSQLDNLQNLKMIGLSGYGFGSFDPIINFKKLEAFMYSDNVISDLTPLVEFHNIIHLELNGNRISDIEPLKDMERLVILKLKKNLISNINSIPEMKHLRYIDLSKNKITDLTPLVESKDLNPNLSITLRGNILRWHSMIYDIQTLKDRGMEVEY